MFTAVGWCYNLCFYGNLPFYTFFLFIPLIKIQNILSFQCLFIISLWGKTNLHHLEWLPYKPSKNSLLQKISMGLCVTIGKKKKSATKISHQITPVEITQCFFHCGCSVETIVLTWLEPLTLADLYGNVDSADSPL